MSVQLIAQREYARRRGVAPSAVAKAIAEGRISAIGGKIDPEVADIQWERNTRARADSGRRAAPSGGEREAKPAGAGAAAAAPSKQDPEYYVDRARRERIDADLAELELMQKRGELYSRQEVDRLLDRVLGRLRPSILQVPGRLAPILAAETDPGVVMAALDAELRAVLATVAAPGGGPTLPAAGGGA